MFPVLEGHYPIYGSPFNLSAFNLVVVSYRFLCMNCVEIWSFELLIFKGMTLVEHMQINSC